MDTDIKTLIDEAFDNQESEQKDEIKTSKSSMETEKQNSQKPVMAVEKVKLNNTIVQLPNLVEMKKQNSVKEKHNAEEDQDSPPEPNHRKAEVIRIPKVQQKLTTTVVRKTRTSSEVDEVRQKPLMLNRRSEQVAVQRLRGFTIRNKKEAEN